MFPHALHFNFFHNVIFVGIAIGLLLGVVLLSTPKFRRRATIFLAIFLLSFSFNNLYYFAIDIRLNTYLPVLNFLPLSLKTLIPVSAYCYILLTIRPDQPLLKKHWLLFIVPVVQFAFYTFLVVLYCFSSEMLISNFSIVERIYRLDELLSVVLALVLTISIVWRIRACLSSQQGDRVQLRWATRFLLLGAVAVLLWAIPFAYVYVTDSYQSTAFYPMWSFSSVLVCWIGVQGLKQPGFFERDTPQPEKLPSALEDRQRINLQEVMRTGKPFKNPALSMKELADLLGISLNQLRRTIKTEEGNYHQFINHYRVEEAKELLTDPQNAHFTIEAIGEMAGFRSRATFFSAFKQHTEQTPQQYKHEHIRLRSS